MKNSFISINDAILILTAAESLLLSILLNILPNKRAQPRRLLSLFFILIAGILSTTLIIWNPYLQSLQLAEHTLIPMLLSVFILLQGPTLYFYLRSLSEDIQLKRWINLIHFLPALIVALVIIVFNVNITAWLPWNRPHLSPNTLAAVKFVWAIVRCSPFVYILACVYAEYKLRQQFKQVYSTIVSNELVWADIVLGGFFITWAWSVVGYFLGGYFSADTNDMIGVFTNYLSIILVNVLFAFGLINTRQLLNLAHIPDDEKPIEIAKKDEKIAAIEEGIHGKKLYLESQINLERFAEQIGVKARDVSIILNSHYHSNFFEFINGYRVEEAKRLLVADDNQNYTILDIIYKAGFNSQSAFHRFFKRIVGTTPSEYRKQYAEKKNQGEHPCS